MCGFLNCELRYQEQLGAGAPIRQWRVTGPCDGVALGLFFISQFDQAALEESPMPRSAVHFR
jgi:hypothetical protein